MSDRSGAASDIVNSSKDFVANRMIFLHVTRGHHESGSFSIDLGQ